MRTSEVLNKAADLIERDGWAHPGSWSGHCALNSIALANGGYGTFHDGAHGGVAEYLSGQRYDLSVIWEWNDAEGRTASEVIEVLRACALIEAAREHEHQDEHQDAAWESCAANVAVSA